MLFHAWFRTQLHSQFLNDRFLQGVEVDKARAFELFELSANQGEADAQVSLGAAYEQGEGVVKNMSQAVLWYLKAADQGSLMAQYQLGLCYEFGKVR